MALHEAAHSAAWQAARTWALHFSREPERRARRCCWTEERVRGFRGSLTEAIRHHDAHWVACREDNTRHFSQESVLEQATLQRAIVFTDFPAVVVAFGRCGAVHSVGGR